MRWRDPKTGALVPEDGFSGTPDPKPAKRIVDHSASPLDMGPLHRFYCACCWQPTQKWHRHHVVGRGQGGDDLPENMAWVCSKCHDGLHGKTDAAHRTRVGLMFLDYCRKDFPAIGAYADRKKYPGWLEDRYDRRRDVEGERI